MKDLVGRKNRESLVGEGLVILKKWKEACVVEEEKVKKNSIRVWFEKNLERLAEA